MIVSVLSGKGGTGKTTVATNLAYVSDSAAYVDCDVEEPNGFLFLKPVITGKEKVSVMVPSVTEEKCSACGECAKWCQFNALALVKQKVIGFLQLCHGCGLCSLVCPEMAIKETPRGIGVIETGQFNKGIFMHGVLKTGEPIAVPIISKLVEKTGNVKARHVIVDCPPGSSCSVIAAVEKSDYCLLVTEPTPFGLHDLKIAVDLIKLLGIPGGVVINKADEKSQIIRDYCSAKNIPVLMELPFSKRIAEAYSAGKMIVDTNPAIRERFHELLDILEGL